MSEADAEPARARKRPLGKTDGGRRLASMPPAPLPALPAEVWRGIACRALAAEGSTVQAVVRLSLVCRTWRECLRGGRSRTNLCCPHCCLEHPTCCSHILSVRRAVDDSLSTCVD